MLSKTRQSRLEARAHRWSRETAFMMSKRTTSRTAHAVWLLSAVAMLLVPCTRSQGGFGISSLVLSSSNSHSTLAKDGDNVTLTLQSLGGVKLKQPTCQFKVDSVAVKGNVSYVSNSSATEWHGVEMSVHSRHSGQGEGGILHNFGSGSRRQDGAYGICYHGQIQSHDRQDRTLPDFSGADIQQ